MPYKEFETDKEEIETFWDKAKVAILSILALPFLHFFSIVGWIATISLLIFSCWFVYLMVRVMLKYLGE